MLFTKMAATTGFYIHPYFYFQKHANSDYGFTCGFDTAPVAHIPAVPEILPWSEVPAVITRAHVPANPATGQLEVLALVGSALVLEVMARAAVIETLAQPPLQCDLHGIFQQHLVN